MSASGPLCRLTSHWLRPHKYTTQAGIALARRNPSVWRSRSGRLNHNCLLVGCLTSQQHASVSQGRICSDNCTCCHTETEVADQTFHLTQSQYTDTGPTSPSADPITPGAWQSSHRSANFEVTGMTRPRKNPGAKRDSNLGPSALEADALTTRPRRRCCRQKEDNACSDPTHGGHFSGLTCLCQQTLC